MSHEGVARQVDHTPDHAGPVGRRPSGELSAYKASRPQPQGELKRKNIRVPRCSSCQHTKNCLETLKYRLTKIISLFQASHQNDVSTMKDRCHQERLEKSFRETTKENISHFPRNMKSQDFPPRMTGRQSILRKITLKVETQFQMIIKHLLNVEKHSTTQEVTHP